MSISKRWVKDPANYQAVLELYRAVESPTVGQVAESLGTTYHNVLHVLKTHLGEAEYKALQYVRYSRSKMGELNPMKGKTGSAHHGFIGECQDGRGYLTCLHDGKRQLVHRVVMAQALGLQEVPENLDVHHIDGNGMNNNLDNLAVVTRRGHQQIHYLQVKDTAQLELKKLRLREALKFMTSQ